jgi:hypothetical protein
MNILVDKYQKAGSYNIVWNPSDIPSGIYYYKIESGLFAKVNKMLYIK